MGPESGGSRESMSCATRQVTPRSASLPRMRCRPRVREARTSTWRDARADTIECSRAARGSASEPRHAVDIGSATKRRHARRVVVAKVSRNHAWLQAYHAVPAEISQGHGSSRAGKPDVVADLSGTPHWPRRQRLAATTRATSGGRGGYVDLPARSKLDDSRS